MTQKQLITHCKHHTVPFDFGVISMSHLALIVVGEALLIPFVSIFHDPFRKEMVQPMDGV